jgi:D-3-phosphoglycerate dehydrogenase
MPTYRALYTDYPWADAEVERELLAEADCELIISPDNKEETLAKLAPGMDVILTCWAPVKQLVINAADRCRHIARTGIGLDNIAVDLATERGILVTNVPDYCVGEVAEHTIASLMALGRKLPAYHAATKAGRYELVAQLPIERINGKTLGIIGLGQIGVRVAQLAAALGLRVLGVNRSGRDVPGVELVSLDDLLTRSDFLSIHCPLTDETRNLINSERFARMKPSAFLINTSRGGLVDPQALAAALAAGHLAGAALDVQSPEPPDLAAPPWNDPRVLVTPHVAFYSTEATHELRTRVGRQVVAFLRGELPENVVNPEALA